MAVDFISSKLPPWKAIQTRLKIKEKTIVPLQVNLNVVQQRSLGPGCYSISEKVIKVASGPKFSTLPRFSPTEKLKLTVPNIDRPASQITSRGSARRKLMKSGIIHKNLYENRFKSADSVGKFKNLIQKSRTEHKIKKISEKNERFFRWNAAKKVIAAQKGWVIFLGMATTARILKLKISTKKRFKSAFKFNSSLLYQVSKVVGKLRIKLKTIKKNRSLRTLSSLLIPYVHVRAQNLIKTHQKNIVYTLELCLTRKMIKKLGLSWSRKMMRLELKLNGLVLIYKSRINMLLKMWSMIETKYNQYSNKKIIPREITERVVRKYFYEKLKKFYFDEKEYRLSQQRFKQELKKIKRESSELYYRKKGLRITFAVKAFPVFRIYHQDEMIRLYLEEEHKLNLNLIA